MSISVNEALSRFKKVEYELSQIVKAVGSYAGNVHIEDENNPDEYLLYQSIGQISDKLEDVVIELKYLSKPIRAEGRLYKNSLGRYEINDNNYFTSGHPIEVLINRGDHDEWVASRIEHSSDYYIVALGRDVSIDGMYCRVR